MHTLLFKAGNLTGMAIKSLVISDLSDTELDDETHVTALARHPDVSFAVKLDLSVEEAAKLTDTTLRLVEFELHAPNAPVRTVRIESKQLDKLFPNWEDVLGSAPKAEQPRSATPTKRAATKSSAAGERIDYTAPDRYGQLHRGRITDEESRLVRENQAQASKNREAQGHPPINWDDAKEKSRYGL